MVRHTQLATVTVSDVAKHCVTGRQWSMEIRVNLDLCLFNEIRELQTRI